MSAEARWRVTVHQHICIGSGTCVGLGPGHFVRQQGLTRARADVVEPDDAYLDAALCCPVGAIEVEDVATGALVAPLD